MLVFIWKLLLSSTIRWVPMCQGFSHFPAFCFHFMLTRLATSSKRVRVASSRVWMRRDFLYRVIKKKIKELIDSVWVFRPQNSMRWPKPGTHAVYRGNWESVYQTWRDLLSTLLLCKISCHEFNECTSQFADVLALTVVYFSGDDNVMGVQWCLRERDHVIIVMPYFAHDRFQVIIIIILSLDIAPFPYKHAQRRITIIVKG